jgi:hypothetical protein
MILYLIQYLSDLCASFSYVVAKKFYQNVFYSTTEMFAYCNIYLLILMLCINPILKNRYNFNLLNLKDYLKNKTIIYVTLLSVLTSYIKTILLSNLFNVSQLTLRSYSIMCPFITLGLCHIFLKDQKLNKSFLFAFLICFAGFFLFNSNSPLAFGFSITLIAYVIFNGYSDYKLKAISHKRGLEMMLFDNVMFLFVSSTVFILASFNQDFTKSVFGVEQFAISKLFNTQNIIPVFALAVLSFFAHNFKMLSYKAKHIAGIIIIGIFFKSFNSILMTYIEHDIIPTMTQSIGIVIMCIGLSFFMYKNYAKNKKF